MSFIVRQSVKGLDDWLHLKYPDINCRLISHGLLVWHRGELRIINLATLEVARIVTSPTRLITFVEAFGSFCFVVSHSGSSSVIQSFNLSSALISVFSSSQRVISIEYLDAYSYICGTDSNSVIWVHKDQQISSFKVFDTANPQVLSLKSYMLDDVLVVACGLSNGQVKLVAKEGVKDSLPFLQDTGKITGIELISYNNKNYFVLFSESPGFVKVIAQSDENADYYEDFSADLEGNPSLLDMVCYEYTCVFILTLNSGVLTLYTYSGGQQMEAIYMSDISVSELKAVVCFSIPEFSVFHYPKETGCDLSMIINAGSEIQTLSITSSKLEKIANDISENCTETSIWQKPDFLTKVIRDFYCIEECKELDSGYSEDDCKIIDILVGLEKSALICDFLLKETADNYVLPEEYVSIVDQWLEREGNNRQQALVDNIVPQVLGEDLEVSKSLGRFLQSFLEHERIAGALKVRTKNEKRLKEAKRRVFICRALIWMNENGIVRKIEGLDWDEHRKNFSKVIEQVRGERFLERIYLDKWAEMVSGDLEEAVMRPIERDFLLYVLLECNENVFCRFVLYFLFELEHVSLEVKAIYQSFVQEFSVTPADYHYARGHWCLDTLLHPKVAPVVNRNFLSQYASDALYELAKVTDSLENNEKLAILNYFYITSVLEQAAHWVLAAEFDWNSQETVSSVIELIFDTNDEPDIEWIRAYALISLVKNKIEDPSELMSRFTEIVLKKGKGHKLPSISFEPSLQKSFLDSLPQNSAVKFFTLISNKMIAKAFEESTEGNNELQMIIRELDRCFRVKRDSPSEKIYVEYDCLLDGEAFRDLSIEDSYEASRSSGFKKGFNSVN